MSKSSGDALPFTGERYVPEISGNIALEHLHRYLVAMSLATDKKVLDIACGEGYGSALLAKHASHVIGIDIDQKTIEHAKSKYTNQNLEFKLGDCAEIPLEDGSIDLIVSFETLEHHDKHEENLSEFKRILQPGGVLIISSPDKKYYSDERNFSNQFHVKELYEDEFRNLLGHFFKNIEIFSQRIVFGSALLPTSEQSPIKNYIYENGEAVEIQGVYKPYYHIALASDGELPPFTAGFFEQPINDSEIIQSWEAAMARRNAELDELRTSNHRLEEELALKNAAEQDFKAIEQDLKEAIERISFLEEATGHQQKEIERLERERTTILSSNSWRITRPIRVLRRVAGNLRGGALTGNTHGPASFAILLHRLRNGGRYLLRGDFGSFIDRLKLYSRGNALQEVIEKTRAGESTQWCILTTPHTLFIARSIADRLAAHNISSEIVTSPPDGFGHDFYIVLCAQMFEKLPPNERRILFQLEQSVSSRWFTDTYLSALENSLAVFEYSLTNIEFLAMKGIQYPHLYYLPIGLSSPEVELPPSEQKEYDFLFYGDSNSSPRRQRMLAELQKRFSVKIYNNLFGEEMKEAIRRARIVVNIHYYDGALLEMPRIQECIALGVPVLSEGSSDQDEYPELSGAVRFFKEDSITDMLHEAEQMLAHVDEHVAQIKVSAAKSADRFAFMLDRALVALKFLPETKIQQRIPYIPGESEMIALSLPETIARRRLLMETKPPHSVVFDGARYRPGWIGCGLSFSVLARYALENKIDRLTIFEDDALFPQNCEEIIQEIHEYLNDRSLPWDIFSGMMAEIHPDTKVLSVDIHKGRTYVTMDRMVSTVFNIYNKQGLELLSKWDPTNHDVERNALDRYLQNLPDLRVVVALPFIVGHREELHSTLWGFQNVQYAPMIAKAENRIHELAEQWLADNKANESSRTPART